MKKIITIILVLISFVSKAQIPAPVGYLPQPAKWKYTNPVWLYQGAWISNLQAITGDTVIGWNPYTHKMGYKIITNSTVDTSHFLHGSDTVKLRRDINVKVKYTDTSTMLAPYFLASDSIQWRNRVRYADTAAMLTKYLRKADTLHMTYSLPLARGGNNLEMYPATTSTDGYLTDADWNIFNNKESVLTFSRGLSRSTNTVILDTTQYYTWTNRVRYNLTTPATANYGLVSLGSGAFDGATSGFFTGAAAGTLIAGNLASGSTSDLLNLQTAGVSAIRVTSTGVTTISGGVKIAAAQDLTWLTRAAFQAPASGVLLMTDAAYTSFNRLQFGGTTSSFPSIKRTADTLIVRKADDSGDDFFRAANVKSGTYTPNLTNTTNVSASTAYVNQYMRVGNVVTVSGKVVIDPTAAGALELEMTLPLSSNFTAEEQCGGAAISDAALDDGVAISGHVTNNTASFHCTAVGTASQIYHFSFTYQIL